MKMHKHFFKTKADGTGAVGGAGSQKRPGMRGCGGLGSVSQGWGLSCGQRQSGALERVAANRGQRVGPYHQARSPGPGHEDEVPGDQFLFSGLQGVSDH